MSILNFFKRHYVYRRDPDVVIGGHDDPYLLRWFVLPRNPICNVYLHLFLRSDDDRALHSHPWLFNLSWLLDGHYVEHTPKGQLHRRQGALKFRWGPAFHWIELIDGACWTLFITGWRCREWGFACPKGFVHWRDFTSPSDSGVTGKGCD